MSIHRKILSQLTRGAIVVCVCFLIAISTGEVLRRLLDGYSLFQLDLVQANSSNILSKTMTRDHLYELAETMVIKEGPGIDLFKQEPIPRPAIETPELLKDRALSSPLSRYHVNFVYNDVFISGSDAAGYIKDDYPEDIFTFRSPDGSKYPRYRHYPSARLTFGLDMNEQGWRSEDIPLKKPPKTIRIAALGDSTTLHQGHIKISYLDFLKKWLEIWASENGFDVDIETINTGREAISSEDTLAILKHEVMPFEPDYILFYGLGNQWDIKPYVKFNEQAKDGVSAATDYFAPSVLEKLLGEHLKPLQQYSATIGWALARLQTGVGEGGAEPRKPSQNWAFPTGMSEQKPDLKTLLRGSSSARFVRDLDTMNTLTKHANTRMFLQTFKFLAHDGLVLPLPEAQGIFNYLNYSYFPYSYQNMDRAVAYMNRIFASWAMSRNVPLIDVASIYPDDHRLFVDAMHNSQDGVKLRAWAVLQQLLPYFSADLATGALPRADAIALDHHPFPLRPVMMSLKDISSHR